MTTPAAFDLRVGPPGVTWRACLALPGSAPVPLGGARSGFEILAITCGEGNGWLFDADTLRASLDLWDGVETFIDHAAQPGDPRSVRDLAGLCQAPRWDEAMRGIRLALRPVGPSAALLTALGDAWLSADGPRPRIGFSADLSFTAQGRRVTRVLRVHAVDLVIHPARGGAFLRAAQFSTQPQGAMTMDPAETTPTDVHAALLDSSLRAAALPPALAGAIRARFAGQAFAPADLDQAVRDARDLLAQAQGGSVISAGRVSEMRDSRDRLQAAVDDLLGAPRDPAMAGAAVERLTGVRELYLMLTGDDDLHGGYHPERVRLETTATLPNLVKNAMNKVITQTWEELGRAGYRWWEPVVAVEHFTSLQPVTGVLVGEVGDLPSIAEGAAYPELRTADSGETGAWTKYGGYLPLTLELIDRDDVARLRAYPRKMASAALRKISALVAGVFSANSGAGPVMADTYNLFEAAHHKNLGTTALSASAWETASQAVYNQPLLSPAGSSPKLAADPRYLLVPRELRLAGWQILYPSWSREANIVSENLQRGQAGDVITVPDWTDANNWAAACDPRIAPAIVIGERFGLQPQIFIAGDEHSPAMFTNDEVRLKIRHFLSVFVADYRPLYKANVV